jgi:uncharacterized membrane protein YgdD (TMEM256/DUF423 family)
MSEVSVNYRHSKFYTYYFACILIFIGISGCFSVLFGAWFAHTGESLPIAVQSRLANALQYQFFHTLALLAIAIWLNTLLENNKSTKIYKTLYISASFFIIGILFFCGVLYLKTFFDFTTIGKIVPFGGMSFALGWLCISWAGINRLMLNPSVDQDRL